MDKMDHTAALRPTLGIGSCLAGNAVRYSGDSKPANRHVQKLCEHFATRAFCPETGIGLGVPRPPIHLVGAGADVRVVDVATHRHDYTDAIRQYADKVLRQGEDLCGYILVRGSPSCGYERVKRYAAAGDLLASDQQGIFAAALASGDSLLPLEDDERLNDPALRESFVSRACTYHAWKQFQREPLTRDRLIDFYARHKHLVMAHHVRSHRAIERMLDAAGSTPVDPLADALISALMRALKQRATRRTQGNVLLHIIGHLERDISPGERQRLADLVHEYRLGNIPLMVPVTMLKQYSTENSDAYIDSRMFLEPSA